MRRLVAAAVLVVALAGCDAIPGAGGGGADVAALETRVKALEDERDVLAVIDKLDLAVDAKDWDGVATLFQDHIQADFSSLGGQPGELASADLVNGWRNNLFAGKPSFHMRAGADVAIDGDSAHVTSNGYAWNALPARTDNNLWEVWGRYDYELKREGGVWKITAMKFDAQYQRGDASIRTESERR